MITEIKEFKELEFDENKHLYRANGFEIPSVTTLMNPLSDDLYSGISAEVMAKAAARGTAVHEAIEMYSKFGLEEIEPEFEAYFVAYKKWHDIYKPEPIVDEFRMYHKTMMYAGTADKICNIGDCTVLIDYKTTSSVNKMLTGVQLEAYAQAMESHGIHIDKKAIVHLKTSSPL